jgi:hypothetical protein
MASVQAAPGVPGPGQLPSNLTKEMVQQVYVVRVYPAITSFDLSRHCASRRAKTNTRAEV